MTPPHPPRGVGGAKCVRNKRRGAADSTENLEPRRVPSDEVHEDFVLHDAGDLGHPALRHGASLTRHQDLTYADEGGGGAESVRG